MDLRSNVRAALPPPASRESALSSSAPLSAAIAQETCDVAPSAPLHRLPSPRKWLAAVHIKHLQALIRGRKKKKRKRRSAVHTGLASYSAVSWTSLRTIRMEICSPPRSFLELGVKCCWKRALSLNCHPSDNYSLYLGPLSFSHTGSGVKWLRPTVLRLPPIF